MVRETRVQSQFKSYQRLKIWYLMPPCLTLSIIRYVLRVKWSNPGNGVVPSPTPQCSSYLKGSQLYFYLHIWRKNKKQDILINFFAIITDSFKYVCTWLGAIIFLRFYIYMDFLCSHIEAICTTGHTMNRLLAGDLTHLFEIRIRDEFKNYKNWSCIYQERNEQWMKY